LRRAGLSVDILPPSSRDFTGRTLVLAPGLMHMPEALKQALAGSGATVVHGPRSGARDGHFSIPDPLPPALPGLDITVARVESLRPDMPVPLDGGGAAAGYLEELEGSAPVLLRTAAGAAAAVSEGRQIYCGAWLDAAGLDRLVAGACAAAGLDTRTMPEGVRCRRTATEEFWFNHTSREAETPAGLLPPAGLARLSLR
jgi:beta-galactosidase